MFSLSNGSAVMSEEERYVDITATEGATCTPANINKKRRSDCDYYPDFKGRYHSGGGGGGG